MNDEILQCERELLEHYKDRLRACIRKGVTSGATYWMQRIHELEQLIKDRQHG